MKKILITSLLIYCISLNTSAQVQWDLSLNYYFETEETVYLDPPDLFSGLSSAIGIRGKAVFPWGNRFVGGVLISYIPSVELIRFEEDGSFVELGVMVGPTFDIGDLTLVTTGEISFRSIPTDNENLESTGLGTNLNVTLIFNSQNNISPKVELGFITQPAGGNDDLEYTFSPYWYIGGGITIN